MSDEALRQVLERMEAWLADDGWEPDPELLPEWESEFRRCLEGTEKGADWPELRRRAHEAGKLLSTRADRLAMAQAEVRAELEAQERGNRALRGYRTSAAPHRGGNP